MSEMVLTLEQKREKCLAVLEALNKTFHEDHQQALKNADASAAQLLEHLNKKQKRTGIIGFLIQLAVKIFVWNDAPVYLPEKGGNEDEVQQMIDRGKQETNRAYAEIYILLDKMAQKVKTADKDVEGCYNHLKSAADGRRGVSVTLEDICNEQKVFLTASNRQFLDSLRRDAGDLAKLQKIVHSEMYEQQ